MKNPWVPPKPIELVSTEAQNGISIFNKRLSHSDPQRSLGSTDVREEEAFVLGVFSHLGHFPVQTLLLLRMEQKGTVTWTEEQT